MKSLAVLSAIAPTLPPGSTATTVSGQTSFVTTTYYKPVLVTSGYQIVRL
jgi:hypothetical protein